MPEEEDLEDYLDKIKRRWNSALLSEEQNDQNWLNWTKESNDDTTRSSQRIFRHEN